MQPSRTIKKEPVREFRALRAVIVRLSFALASAKSGIVVTGLLVVACVIGTILPQRGAAERYFDGLPNSAAWVKVSSILGFTHIFSSWWFIGLLFILASGVAASAACRCAAMRRVAGVELRRSFASAVTHLSLLLIFAGGLVRVVWGETGRLTLREGETLSMFTCASRPRELPFAMRFDRLQVETEATPREIASTEPVVGTVIKEIRSSVAIVTGASTEAATIGVNAPLVRDGYRIYQLADSAERTGRGEFQVVRDPGMPLVYTGFALLLTALVITLYINPWLNSRRTHA